MTRQIDTREAKWRKYIPHLTTSKSSGGQVYSLSPIEIDLLVDTAKDLDLDPILGEVVIYKGRPYVTEAGLMKKAILSGELDGLKVDAIYDDPDGRGERWIAVVTLYKKGCAQPFQMKADQLEYKNPSSTIWAKNGRSMTEKCCTCKTVRHAFAISVPSFEEMAVDEITGISGEEAQTAERAEKATAAGEKTAAAKADAKTAAKAQKQAEKASKVTQEQFAQIGALYKTLDLRRDGDSGSEALFRKTFAKANHPHLQDKHEQFLTTTEAKTYILALWNMAADHICQKLGIGSEEYIEALNHVCPKAKGPDEILDEEWPRILTAVRRRALAIHYADIGWDADKADQEFVTHFPEATCLDDVDGGALDAYILGLTKHEEPAEVGSEGEPTQGSLLASEEK